MNPASQRRARDLARLADEPDEPGTAERLARLERRADALERQVGGLELRLADSFARERAALRAEIERLQTSAAASAAKPKRTPASKKA